MLLKRISTSWRNSILAALAPCNGTGWEADWMESSSVEKDMGILVGNTLNVSQQCALAMKTNCILGFISKAVTSRSTEAVIPPCLAL